MKNKTFTLHNIGIALIIIGGILLLTAIPFVPQSMVEVGVSSVKVEGISEGRAIQLFVGVIFLLVGTGILIKDQKKSKKRKRFKRK